MELKAILGKLPCRRCDLPVLIRHSSGLCAACRYIVRFDRVSLYREKQATRPGEPIAQFIFRHGHDTGFVVSKQPKPTLAVPGSVAKVLELSERIARAEELFIEEDFLGTRSSGQVPWEIPCCKVPARHTEGEVMEEEFHSDHDYWGHTSG